MFRLWQRLQFFAGFLILGVLFAALWYGMLLYSEHYVRDVPEPVQEEGTVVVPPELRPGYRNDGEGSPGESRENQKEGGGDIRPVDKTGGDKVDMTLTGEDPPQDEAPDGQEADDGSLSSGDAGGDTASGEDLQDKSGPDGESAGGKGEGAVIFGKQDAANSGKKAGENGQQEEPAPEPKPDLNDLAAMMQMFKVEKGDPVFLRIIKADRLMELWMKPREKDAYVVVKKYPIQAMSGKLGPKKKQGDMQAPEGFYRTFAGALNPNSHYHLSFNVGYPNAWDRMNKRTGSLIMVHGCDVSAGCFAMGNEGVEEIYGLVEAFVKSKTGAEGVPIQIYPFIPTQKRLTAMQKSEHYPFWRFLKDAWDWTELHKAPAPVRIGDKAMILEGNMLTLEGLVERQVYRQAKLPKRWGP